MNNDIETKLSEDVHYEIIPSEDKHGWNIRLLEEFPETVIAFDVIELVENEEQISFNFGIVSTPDPDLTTNDLTLQEFTGRILTSLLEVAVSDGTLVARDKETNEIMATDEMHEEMELYNEEHQSGTDDTEESVNQ
jgi:hypothetical protein